jgi:DNA-binding transcriptional LysR family regulator
MSDPTLSLQFYRALAATIEEGSYSAAGQRLGTSHVAVAQHIRNFEERRGLRLLERERGRLVPSPIGQQLAEIGARMEEANQEAVRLLERKSPSGRATLRVGLGNAMPGLRIIDMMIRHHPNLTVSIQSASHRTVLNLVMRREVDVAVLPDLPPDPRLKHVAVLSQTVVAIASHTHPLAGGRHTTLEELATHPLIFRARGSSTQRVIDRAFAQIGLEPQPVLVADTRDAVLEAVNLGIGIGFMWDNGTGRVGQVRQIPIQQISHKATEVAFALRDERNELADVFLLMAQRL